MVAPELNWRIDRWSRNSYQVPMKTRSARDDDGDVDGGGDGDFVDGGQCRTVMRAVDHH